MQLCNEFKNLQLVVGLFVPFKGCVGWSNLNPRCIKSLNVQNVVRQHFTILFFIGTKCDVL